MGSGDVIEIKDRETFPGRISAVRDAVEQLRAAASKLSQISETATKEAGSFTKDGSPAPVYAPLLRELSGWRDAITASTTAICTSAGNCAETLKYKFDGITRTDNRAAGVINGMSSGGGGGGGVPTSDGTGGGVSSSGGGGADAAVPSADETPTGAGSLAELEKQIGAKAGIAYMPLFGDNPQIKTMGDLQGGDAWSTMKAPVVLAALRENGGHVTPDMIAAITHSDNDAANRVWASLGDPRVAAEKVQAVLHAAGDTDTVVNAVKDPNRATAFGQTNWSLGDQLKFMNYLSHDNTAAPLRALMGQVEGDQRWGLGQLGGDAVFKGGWGPGADGSYTTRQMGIVDGPGGKYAVAIMVHPNSGQFGDSQTDMTQISKWITFN